MSRILIVDDQTLFRQSLADYLSQRGYEVIGEASDGLEGVKKAQELLPDIILMDLRMPVCSGVEATRTIRQIHPQVQIIILTVSEKDDDMFMAIKAGAKGYLLKTVGAKELLSALRSIEAGESVISPAMATKLFAEFASAREAQPTEVDAAGTGLTEREREVLALVAEGATNRDISIRLCIAEGTVKVHLRNILDKLHLHNRVQIVTHAMREGIIQLDR